MKLKRRTRLIVEQLEQRCVPAAVKFTSVPALLACNETLTGGSVLMLVVPAVAAKVVPGPAEIGPDRVSVPEPDLVMVLLAGAVRVPLMVSAVEAAVFKPKVALAIVTGALIVCEPACTVISGTPVAPLALLSIVSTLVESPAAWAMV